MESAATNQAEWMRMEVRERLTAEYQAEESQYDDSEVE